LPDVLALCGPEMEAVASASVYCPSASKPPDRGRRGTQGGVEAGITFAGTHSTVPGRPNSSDEIINHGRVIDRRFSGTSDGGSGYRD
jgi:hypothetical protein